MKEETSQSSSNIQNAILIGSPHDFYYHSKDPSSHTLNQLQEFKRRMSKSGSSGSESDIEISESYRRRLAEKAVMMTIADSPSAFTAVPLKPLEPESQEGQLANVERRRDTFVVQDLPPKVGIDSVMTEGRRKSEVDVAAAVTTLDRRLRRPLKARESESMLLMNE